MPREHRQQIKPLYTIHIIEPFAGLLIELERKALLPSLQTVAGLKQILLTVLEKAYLMSLVPYMFLTLEGISGHKENCHGKKAERYSVQDHAHP